MLRIADAVQEFREIGAFQWENDCSGIDRSRPGTSSGFIDSSNVGVASCRQCQLFREIRSQYPAHRFTCTRVNVRGWHRPLDIFIIEILAK